MKKKQEFCKYCGKKLQKDNDRLSNYSSKAHVVPRKYFLEGTDLNGLTIRSCKKCNQGMQKDEDYMWLNILTEAVFSSFEAKQIFEEKILRKTKNGIFKGKGDSGLVRSFLKTVQKIDLKSESGIDLGEIPIIKPELKRINRCMKMLILGLYILEYENNFKLVEYDFSHTYKSIDLDKFSVKMNENNKIDFNGLNLEMTSLIDVFKEKKVIMNKGNFCKDNIFEYWFSKVEEKDNATSIWMVFFYKIPWCLSMVSKKENES